MRKLHAGLLGAVWPRLGCFVSELWITSKKRRLDEKASGWFRLGSFRSTLAELEHLKDLFGIHNVLIIYDTFYCGYKNEICDTTHSLVKELLQAWWLAAFHDQWRILERIIWLKFCNPTRLVSFIMESSIAPHASWQSEKALFHNLSSYERVVLQPSKVEICPKRHDAQKPEHHDWIQRRTPRHPNQVAGLWIDTLSEISIE